MLIEIIAFVAGAVTDYVVMKNGGYKLMLTKIKDYFKKPTP